MTMTIFHNIYIDKKIIFITFRVHKLFQDDHFAFNVLFMMIYTDIGFFDLGQILALIDVCMSHLGYLERMVQI